MLSQIDNKPIGSEWKLPCDFYISPTPEKLAARILSSNFSTEARQLHVSCETLAAALIRGFASNT
jgi:hypothetical protein